MYKGQIIPSLCGQYSVYTPMYNNLCHLNISPSLLCITANVSQPEDLQCKKLITIIRCIYT